MAQRNWQTEGPCASGTAASKQRSEPQVEISLSDAARLPGQKPVRDGSIAVIIVNYNGGDQVIECLRSLRSQTYVRRHVIVVDNLSRDGSLEAIREGFPEVTIIETGYNAGWGIACNVGIEATRSEYVTLLNNDSRLDAGCLEEMVRAINGSPKYGSCASKILLWDDPAKIEVTGLVIARDGLSVGRGRLQSAALYQLVEEVFCANDCCCLYRREMLDDIGLYDPDFFMYANETDIGWRQQLAGWKCIYTPHAVAYHAHSRAAGSYTDFKAYHVERNRIFLCLKYFPVWDLMFSFWYASYRYLMQIWLAQQGSGSLARYREGASLWQGLRVLARAYGDALRMAPVMLRRRRQYRDIRRLSAHEIRSLFSKYGVTMREMAAYE